MKKLDLKPNAVELHVKDLEKQRNFYTEVLGLEVLQVDSDRISLGKNNAPLVILSAAPLFSRASQDSAGLYHFAILFQSRGELARTVHQVLLKKPELFTGSADHLVSEAFYFNDIEGNGIELYFDRDSSRWEWENNEVKMASMYIDPREYLQKYVTLEERNMSVQMGHFHLKVGSISQAKYFYVDILGFDITASFPGALFLSVNGYHHHLGINTWESKNARKRGETLGLKAVEFRVRDHDVLRSIEDALHKENISYAKTPESLIFQDPWNNTLRLTILA